MGRGLIVSSSFILTFILQGLVSIEAFADKEDEQVLYSPQLDFYLVIKENLFVRYQATIGGCWRAPAGYLPLTGPLDESNHPDLGSNWRVESVDGGVRLGRPAEPINLYLQKIRKLPPVCNSTPDDTPLAVFDQYVITLKQFYHFKHTDKPSWMARASQIRDNIASYKVPERSADNLSKTALFDALAELTYLTNDAHVFLIAKDLKDASFGDHDARADADAQPDVERHFAASSDKLIASDTAKLLEVKGRWYANRQVYVGSRSDLIYVAPVSFAGIGGAYDPTSDHLFDEAAEAVHRARRFRPRAPLVFDVRGNTGGSVVYANLIADAVASDPVVATWIDIERNGQVERTPLGYVSGLSDTPDVEIYVLVDQQTASAAEHFTHTLVALGATVVGDTATTGTLSPAVLRSLPNSWILGVAPFRVTGVNEIELEGVPIEPALSVSAWLKKINHK